MERLGRTGRRMVKAWKRFEKEKLRKQKRQEKLMKKGKRKGRVADVWMVDRP